MYGVELAGTLPFETFAAALEGFGVTGGVSYTKSPKMVPGPALPKRTFRAISKWVANGTLYYEN